MQRESAIARLPAILDEFGISAAPLDFWEAVTEGSSMEVTLRRGNSSQGYTVESSLDTPDQKEQARANQLVTSTREAEARRLLVVARRLNSRTKTAYRSRDIDFVDLAGNARIRFGDVYIDVQGRSAKEPTFADDSRRAPVNLFSARRAQATFALVVWPELLAKPVRYTSEAAGVSIGIAFQTVQLLRQSGYVTGESVPHLVRKEELIDRWTDAYKTGLNHKLVLARFRGDNLEVSGGDSAGQWLVGGESAVRSLLRPSTLTIYVDQLEPGLIAANRWRRDGAPNIEVRKKFWNAGDSSPSDESPDVEPRVPALLIYADLMASGDGRQREAAQAFRKEHAELFSD